MNPLRILGIARSAPHYLSGLALTAALTVGGLGGVGIASARAAAAPAANHTITCARTDVSCVIAFGNLHIDERTAALTRLNDRANEQVAAGHITSNQAAAIQADVASNQSGLAALKGKLDAETDAAAARQDVRSIYTQFRIYLVVLPRDYHEIVLDMMTNVQAKLAGLEPTLQQAIQNAAADEQQQLKALYGDYTANVEAASTRITAADGLVAYFTPDNINNSPATYRTNWLTFRSDILAGRANLRQAASDLHQISAILKAHAATATPTA
jgi:hypothetical protein